MSSNFHLLRMPDLNPSRSKWKISSWTQHARLLTISRKSQRYQRSTALFFLVTSRLEDYQTNFSNCFLNFLKALGAYLSRIYSDDVVVLLATLIAILDLLFILCCVPESRKQPQTVIEGINSNGFSANPFIILRFLRDEQTILRLSAITFLSYLPEAGQFSCFFVYLRLVG